MIPKDELGISNRKELRNLMDEGEEVLFSARILKINVRNKQQKRNMVITNMSIFNIRDGGLLTGTLNMFSNTAYLKRRIPLTKIEAIVYAKLGNEFVIHVPTEFDYRIISDRKDIMVMYLLYALKLNGINEIRFYFHDEIELGAVTTHNSQKKKGIINDPVGHEKQMTLPDFEVYLKEKIKQEQDLEKMTEMIISTSKNKISLNDFNLLKTLGKGGFGKVYLVEKKDTKELYALKTIKKLFIIEKKQLEQVMREKEILHEANHPFLVGLKSAFQTPDKLFFLMPFVQGGDLYVQLKRRRYFKEFEVKFFVAQIMEALGFLHTKNIIYQDLKPENILLGNNGYVKLADFGAAKYVYQTKTYKTFIGTADYIAPEVLRKLPYNKSVDWWSLGILMYELLFGRTPFYNKNPKATFKLILTQEPSFKHPENKISPCCKSFIMRLLTRDPKRRIGSKNDNLDLRDHPWMAEVNFSDLLSYKLNAPIIPEVSDEFDTDNFNQKYTNERPKMTMLSEDLVKQLSEYDTMFTGFYYDQILEKDEALMKAKAAVVGDYNDSTEEIIIEEIEEEEGMEVIKEKESTPALEPESEPVLEEQEQEEPKQPEEEAAPVQQEEEEVAPVEQEQEKTAPVEQEEETAPIEQEIEGLGGGVREGGIPNNRNQGSVQAGEQIQVT